MLVQPKCFSFNHGIYSFMYKGARLWNSVDPHFKVVIIIILKSPCESGKEQIVNVMYVFVCAAEQLNRKFMTLHVLLRHCIYHRVSSLSYCSTTILSHFSYFSSLSMNSTVY